MANDTINKVDFERAVNVAVEQHSRVYTAAFSLHIRWEDDETEADRDRDNFAGILTAFGFGPPELLIIARRDPTPLWTVMGRFLDLLGRAKEASAAGRVVVFIHYAGHGEPDTNGELIFVGPPGSKEVSFEGCFKVFMPRSGGPLEDNSPVDTVVLLDCCYSFLATRDVRPVGRVIEVLAAADPSTPRAFVPGRRVSFTGKLYTKIAFLKGQKKQQSIDIADLAGALRTESSAVKPTYKLVVGNSSVRLYFPDSNADTTGVQSPAGPSALEAVFRVHITETFTADELRSFIQWIHTLNPRVGLTLEGVYETGSMLVIMRGPYATFLKLDGLPGISLVCETSSGNLLNAGSAPNTASAVPSLRDTNVSPAVYDPKNAGGSTAASGTENVRPSKRPRLTES